jgi:hypothetical protein
MWDGQSQNQPDFSTLAMIPRGKGQGNGRRVSHGKLCAKINLMSIDRRTFIDIDPRHDDLHISVDLRKDKPFHCDYCGDTYEECRHWHTPAEIMEYGA